MGGLSPASVLSGIQQIGVLTGAVSPVLGNIAGVVEAIAGASEIDKEEQRRRELVANQDLALKQLAETQRLQEAQDAQASSLDKQKLALDAKAAARARQAALKRAMARQTAQFGASGTGSSGGSAQAVLLGLFDESDEEREERERLDALKSKALDMNLDNQRSINVLQRSQLEEKQQLERATKF